MAKTFTRHYSLTHADRVLKLVRALWRALPEKDRPGVTVQAWSNCREQGYSLENNDLLPREWVTVNFAQQRNSDEVLVIAGPSEEFDVTTNAPSDALWERAGARECYRDDDHAARAILSALQGKPLPLSHRAGVRS